MSVQDVINLLKQNMDVKSKKEKERRIEKREEKGVPPPKPRKEHPVHVAEEEEGGNEGRDEMDDFDQLMADDDFWALASVGTKSRAVNYACTVNGKSVVALLDSGAEVTMCRPEVAEALGLKFSDERKVKFKGVGSAFARVSDPVGIKLEACTVECVCPVFVLDIPADVIIGRGVLRESNAVLDFSKNEVSFFA